MNYEKHYEQLIERAKNRNLDCYTEKHHIVPRCMGGNDDYSNIVKLTAREHFIAHILLVKIHPKHYGLIKAVNMMCLANTGMKRESSNRMYGWLKERFSESASMSQTGKNNSQYGTRWIHNLDLKKSKKIPKNEHLPDGWLEGRKINFTKKQKPPKKCKICGEYNCCRNEICKKYKIFPTLAKYFNMDISKIGTNEILDEYDKVLNKIEKDYIIDKMSIPEMVKKYNHYDVRNFNKILNTLGIKKRNLSESQINIRKK